jgi:hypothetical protein
MIMLTDFQPTATNYMTIGCYGTSGKFRSRLCKVKKTTIEVTIGNAATNTFGTYFTATAVAWYKPCYRKSDNVPGWYDTANDVFYPNEGTGVFIVGPDIN